MSLPSAHLQLGAARVEAVVLEDLLEVDGLARRVRHLDADHGLARDGRHDAHRLRLERHGQVVLELGDLADLVPGAGRELVHGDHRARVDLLHLAVDAVVAPASRASRSAVTR